MALGNWLKDFGGFLDLIQNLAQQDGETVYRGEIDSGKQGKGLRAVYDLRFRVGSLAEGATRHGEAPEKLAEPVEQAEPRVMEPAYDLFEEDHQVVIIVQMPGIQREEIQLHTEGDILIINAAGKDRRYSRELLLPFTPPKTSIETYFSSGVLEIRIKKPAEK